ncbi:MAG: hypothetical protein R3F24_05035 [Gammaproteobacteria bacterium]
MSTDGTSATVYATAATPRGSATALWGGIVFSLAFTGLIAYAGSHWLTHGALTPERPGFWYQWQLQVPDVWSRATAWAGYTVHQVTIWWLIWSAQQQRPAYTAGLHRFNVLALAVNAVFIGLHFVQTQVWYDGLAQDVHEATAQWSVILLLIAVLVMENRRRGLVFGRGSAWMERAGPFLRRYHGYYFAWATIYTFWYHPMEDTWGHLFGFFYMFLLMLQGSLFYTRAHLDRRWTVSLEVTFAIHGAMVAWLAGHSWRMFLMGGLAMFVITQMHGLGLSRRARWLISLGYVGAALALYAGPGWTRLPELAGIPLTLLGGAFVLALVVLGGRRALSPT